MLLRCSRHIWQVFRVRTEAVELTRTVGPKIIQSTYYAPWGVEQTPPSPQHGVEAIGTAVVAGLEDGVGKAVEDHMAIIGVRRI